VAAARLAVAPDERFVLRIEKEDLRTMAVGL
jgi:hypothetical protein